MGNLYGSTKLNNSFDICKFILVFKLIFLIAIYNLLVHCIAFLYL